jgi:hypothetical protein
VCAEHHQPFLGRRIRAMPAVLRMQSQRLAERMQQPRAPDARGAEDRRQAKLESVVIEVQLGTAHLARISCERPDLHRRLRVVVERVPVSVGRPASQIPDDARHVSPGVNGVDNEPGALQEDL